MKFHEACGDYNCHAVFSMSIDQVDVKPELVERLFKALEYWRTNHRHNHLVMQEQVVITP